MGDYKKQQSGKMRAKRAGRRKQKIQYKQNKTGMLCISAIVLFFFATMSIQLVGLHAKNETLKEEEQKLISKMKEEEERREEVLAHQEFITTPEYIEQVAKTRLGLIHSNEIIFKERMTEP